MLVGALSSHSTAWRVDLQLLGADVSFKIDTGADVSVIPESLFQSLPHKPPLQLCQHAVASAANTNLETVGQFAAEISSATTGTTSTCSIYAVHELHHCSLGCQDSVALCLIKPLFSMTAVPDEQDAIVSHTADVPDQVSPLLIPDLHPSPIPNDIQKDFPALFTGLDCLQDPYMIQLADDAKPYCQYTARNVPLPLRPRVEAELTRMEQLGDIWKVTEPTDWCAAMVAAPKANGSVRICVDLKP